MTIDTKRKGETRKKVGGRPTKRRSKKKKGVHHRYSRREDRDQRSRKYQKKAPVRDGAGTGSREKGAVPAMLSSHRERLISIVHEETVPTLWGKKEGSGGGRLSGIARLGGGRGAGCA